MNELLNIAINAAIEAGNEILKVYNTDDFDVEFKKDDSPLTKADKQSHNKIMEFLSQTNLPVLSEEGNIPNYEIRKNWTKFWCIDPLDGTKEFIKRNGDFTVNIALIENGKAVMGVIFVPVKSELYFGDLINGARKIENVKKDYTVNDILEKSQKLPINYKRNSYVVVASRSHMNKETEEFITKLKKEHKNIEIISRGSSLKLCMVAEGKADIYPRFAPTMEWDTAAGSAIVNAAGFKVVKAKEPESELVYNKENLLNPWFIVK